ncbi:MAG: hypothetical protein HY002_05700 [Candidatus Rokubacteria bacterium]|nr:hypothetical protein [Candidatus Rokubacteria bacterium]
MRPWSRAGAVAVLMVLGSTETRAGAEPAWWFTIAGQAGIETGRLGDLVGTEDGGLVGLGVHLLRLGPLLFGPEIEASAGRLSADLGTAGDHVTVWRGRLGLRANWWPEDTEPRLVPYARGGAVYRADRGDLIEDDGLGWYLGVGVDARLTKRWALGPFVTYEAVSLSIGTETFLFGVRLTFSP